MAKRRQRSKNLKLTFLCDNPGKKPLTYGDVTDWEFDPDSESVILMLKDGRIVDILFLEDLVDGWLAEMKDEPVFSGDPAEI